MSQKTPIELYNETFDSINKLRDRRKAKEKQLNVMNEQKDQFKKALFDQVRGQLADFLKKGDLPGDTPEEMVESIKQSNPDIFGQMAIGKRASKRLSALQQLQGFKKLREEMPKDERKQFEQELTDSMVNDLKMSFNPERFNKEQAILMKES